MSAKKQPIRKEEPDTTATEPAVSDEPVTVIPEGTMVVVDDPGKGQFIMDATRYKKVRPNATIVSMADGTPYKAADVKQEVVAQPVDNPDAGDGTGDGGGTGDGSGEGGDSSVSED